MTGQEERSLTLARRKSYQKGTVFRRGQKGNMVWVGRWWENGLGDDGLLRRVRRSKVLGTTVEISSRREAQLSLDRYLVTHNSGRQRVESKMKFRDFIEGRWLTTVVPAFKLSTRLQYSYFMHKYLLPYFGGWKLEEIRPDEVQRFLSAYGAKLAPKTVRSMAAALSSSLRTAVGWGFLEINPVRGVLFPPRRSVRERRALSSEEATLLLANLKEPCNTLVRLILLTGMRIGEALALRWGKIDWEEKTLRVDEGAYEGELSTPKTLCAMRTLPMSDVLTEALKAWGRGRCHNPDELVFPNELGKVYARRNLCNRQLKPAAQAAGIKGVGWHALRRTHSTWLKDVGAPPGVIQNQLGHSDPRVAFELYVLSVPGERRSAIDRLSERLERISDPNSTQRIPPSSGDAQPVALKSAG